MIKKKIVTIVSMILITVIFSFCFEPVGTKADEIYECSFPVIYGQTEARAMLPLINNLRQTASDSIYKNDLIYDYDLEKVAMQRAAELAILVDDLRPDGNSYTQTLAEFGFNTGRRGAIYGENVAYGTLESMDMESTYEFWRDDPGCRKNLLSGFSYVGIGHIKIDKLDYWAVVFSTDAKNTNSVPAKDAETIVTVKVRSSIVGSVRVDFESGSSTVQAGETASAPRYIPSVEFYNRDPNEELVLAPLEFNSNDGTVAAYSGLIAGIKEGNGTISANLLGRTFSYDITVTPGNGNVVNIPTPTITQAPTQVPTQVVTPTVAPITGFLLPTQDPNYNATATPAITETPTQAPSQSMTQSPTQAVTQAPTQTVTQSPTQAVTQSPTQTVTQSPTQTVTQTPTQIVTQSPTQAPVQETYSMKKGEMFIVDGLKYRVLTKSTVEVMGFASTSKATKLEIPETVKLGTKYKVVKVADGAFSKNKKLTTVILSKNITTIGKKAFYGCKKLKSITFSGSKLKKVGKKSFNGIYSKAVIKCPNSVVSKYEKLIKSGGAGSKVKVNSN